MTRLQSVAYDENNSGTVRRGTVGDEWDEGTEINQRLDRMIEVSDALDVPLDHVVTHMGRCSQTEFLMLSANPSRLPRYTKSIVNP